MANSPVDSVSNAPAAGHIFCPLEDIPDGQAKGFRFGEGRDQFSMLVMRLGPQAYGYLNQCPHAWTPLDWEEDKFMSLDGDHLQCATHGALFTPETGACVLGPCKGRALTAVPVIVRDGQVVMAGD